MVTGANDVVFIKKRISRHLFFEIIGWFRCVSVYCCSFISFLSFCMHEYRRCCVCDTDTNNNNTATNAVKIHASCHLNSYTRAFRLTCIAAFGRQLRNYYSRIHYVWVIFLSALRFYFSLSLFLLFFFLLLLLVIRSFFSFIRLSFDVDQICCCCFVVGYSRLISVSRERERARSFFFPLFICSFSGGCRRCLSVCRLFFSLSHIMCWFSSVWDFVQFHFELSTYQSFYLMIALDMEYSQGKPETACWV